MLQYIKEKLTQLERRINSISARTLKYKVYTALLTQSGTNAPVATVLQNTLGGTVVWTRTGVGVYIGTLAAAFPVAKTVLFVTTTSGTLTEAGNNEDGEPSNEVFVRTLGADDALYLASLEIRVYP